MPGTIVGSRQVVYRYAGFPPLSRNQYRSHLVDFVFLERKIQAANSIMLTEGVLIHPYSQRCLKSQVFLMQLVPSRSVFLALPCVIRGVMAFTVVLNIARPPR